MRSNRRKTLTFGDLVAYVFSTCNQRNAKAVLRFAVNQHLIVFRGRQRFVIS